MARARRRPRQTRLTDKKVDVDPRELGRTIRAATRDALRAEIVRGIRRAIRFQRGRVDNLEDFR